MRHSTIVRSVSHAAMVVAASAAGPGVLASQAAGHAQKAVHGSHFEIPASIRAEHEAIHAELVAATKVAGRVGAAARELAAVLHPHFQREEQIALPPLALLAPLSRGEAASPMRDVLPMTDSLRAELPRMLEEHVAIRAATLRLGKVARAAGNVRVRRLAESLALHAQGEEELFYPAAVLVGDLVRARVPKP